VQRADLDEARELGERKVHVVDMEMDEIELVGAVQDFLKHHKMMGEMIGTLVVIEPK
jgi:hypothetical protein